MPLFSDHQTPWGKHLARGTGTVQENSTNWKAHRHCSEAVFRSTVFDVPMTSEKQQHWVMSTARTRLRRSGYSLPFANYSTLPVAYSACSSVCVLRQSPPPSKEYHSEAYYQLNKWNTIITTIQTTNEVTNLICTSKMFSCKRRRIGDKSVKSKFLFPFGVKTFNENLPIRISYVVTSTWNLYIPINGSPWNKVKKQINIFSRFQEQLKKMWMC